jgi:regulator of sigma E protease
MMYWVGIDGVRPYVGVVEPGTHAERAGLQERDLLLAVGDESVRTWDEARLAMLDQGIDATALTLSVQTDDGQRIERTLDLADTRILKEEGDFLQALGVAPWRPFTPIIAEVQPGGAAEQAGLLDGDIVRRVDGERTLSLDAFIAQLRASPERELTLTVERDGALLERSLIPASRIDDGRRVGFINARLSGEMPEALRDQLRTTVAYGPLEGLQRGAVKTWDMTVLTLRVLARLVTGEANVKNISGPIGIAEFAGVSAVIGLAYFLGFLAIVSISLGVLNLLPIPILDGGHLLYYLVEWVKGSPVSEATQAFGQRIGLAMLGALMVLALYNDVTRLLD